MTTDATPDLEARLQQWFSESMTAWKHDNKWLLAQIDEAVALLNNQRAELTACRAEQARLQGEVTDLASMHCVSETNCCNQERRAMIAEEQVTTLTAARNEFREIAALFHNALVGAGTGGAFNRRLLDEAVTRFDVAEDPHFHDPTDSMTEFKTMKEQRRP